MSWHANSCETVSGGKTIAYTLSGANCVRLDSGQRTAGAPATTYPHVTRQRRGGSRRGPIGHAPHPVDALYGLIVMEDDSRLERGRDIGQARDVRELEEEGALAIR